MKRKVREKIGLLLITPLVTSLLSIILFLSWMLIIEPGSHIVAIFVSALIITFMTGIWLLTKK